MNTKDIIEYCKKWGVEVDRSQASRWIKEYEGGGGTKSVTVMINAMLGTIGMAPVVVNRKPDVPEKYDVGKLVAKRHPKSPKNSTPPPKEKKANFVPAPVHDIGPHSTLRPMGEFVPVVDNQGENLPEKALVRRKSSTKVFLTSEEMAKEKFVEAAIRKEAFRVTDEQAGIKPLDVSESIQLKTPSIITNEKGWIIRQPEKRVVETEVKFIEPIEVGRAESVPNGWKFDPVLRKTGFIWNEVVYSHKGFLEVGTLVRLDGETVELEIQGKLKLISE